MSVEVKFSRLPSEEEDEEEEKEDDVIETFEVQPEKKTEKKKPVFCIVVNIMLLVIILVLLFILLAFIVHLAPIVSFRHFTAECQTFFFNGDVSGISRVQKTKTVVFDKYRWFVDSYYEDKLLSRMFSTKKDDSKTCCERIGNHDNCYVVTSDDENVFVVPGTAVTLGTVDCTDYAKKTGRQIDVCDVYSYSEGSWVKKVYLDHDTNYPVMVQTTAVVSDATITETYYMSFNPEQPTDESGLKPFDDVKVYDLRNGKGDAGNGKSNLYTENYTAESLMNSLFNLFSLKNYVYSQKAGNEKDPLDIYMKPVSLNSELRNMLQLPPAGLPSNYVSRSSSSNTRDIGAIPASFDARNKWPKCNSTISTITNQGSCGSCWAMAGSSVLADRYCIATGTQKRLSPQYLVYCAPHSNGCSGTESEIAVWEDITKIGIPLESCVPFKGHNGECPTRCQDGKLITDSMKVRPSGYNIPWAKTDKERVEAIQKEIMTNGPVEAFYFVFSDFSEFFFSSTGIYHRSADARYKNGGHAIRIIGWGTESGQDYWLIANSYGTDHPAGGYFRMRRGNNECNIEEQVAAGIFA